MQIFETLINVPLGYVLSFSYKLVNSYGLALILFTLFIKLLLLPLGIKQQKSQVNMMKIKPKEEMLRKKYANNKAKLDQEIMTLYQAEKVNPMSGCLPLLLQFPILIGLYGVINKPLTYLMHLSADHIGQIDKILGTAAGGTGYNQIQAAHMMSANMDKIAHISPNIFAVDFNFLGIDLSQTPNIKEFGWLWLIPIIATLTSYLSSIISQKMSGMGTGDAGGQAAGMNKTMMMMMPLMSLWIAFTTPAAMGFYWTLSNVLMVLQTVLLTKFYNPQAALEEAKAAISVSNNQKKKQRRMLKLEQDRILEEEAAELKRSEQEQSEGR